MSFAWELTDIDVAIVLARHDLDRRAVEVFEEHFVSNPDNTARVEQAALAYLDMDDQTESALDEIETILIEAGVFAAKS